MIIFLATAAGLFLAALLYSAVVGNSVQINEITIKSEKLPQSFDGYRIAFISDLHDKTFHGNNRQLLEKLRKAAPDLIAVGGDMHAPDKDDGTYCELIRRLCEIAPTYAVEGNHDAYYHLRKDYAQYNQKLAALGLHNLKGSVFLNSGNEKIILNGVSYHEFKPEKIAFDEAYFNILLLHNPFSFDKLPQKPDLTLSGHVHGGCIRLPFVGGLLSPGEGAKFLTRFQTKYFFPKYSKGVYRHGNAFLAVSTGLGGVEHIPIRFLRPEILVIRLICD